METLTLKSVRKIISHWWLMLLAGILFICLGIWIISFPVQSYLTLSFAFVFGIIAAGLLEIVFTIINHKLMKRWGLALIGGIVDVLIGVYLFSYPLIALLALPLIIGFWMLFRGIMVMVNALDIYSYGQAHWKIALITGIIMILLSLMILTNPAFGFFNIIVWTGLTFILSGIFRIYLAFKLKRLIF